MGKKSAAANPNTGDEELHAAARSGDLAAVEAICTANPLAVSARDRHSPNLSNRLHLAAWSGHAEIVNYLCKTKADVGAAAMDDMGAIHFAAQKGHLQVVKILVASGVSVKSCNRKGMTALHYAAQGSNLELVRYLLKKGANRHSKNKAGKSAVDLASSEEIRKLLVEFDSSSSSKVVLEGEQKETKDETNVSSREEGEVSDGNDGLQSGKEGEDQTHKRKGEEGEILENEPGTKKPKVALNHLLAEDDTQQEEEDE